MQPGPWGKLRRSSSVISPSGSIRVALASSTALLIAMPAIAFAQTVGPSPPTITAPINVTAGTTTVVGSTNVATTGATNASNVTGGTLLLDSAAGPRPGPITFQTVNGNALQANGGTITASSGNVGITTQGGHAVLSNGVASSVTLSGVSITTTGVGSALAAIGGTIDATAVVINNTATAGPTISAGHGAVAEGGGTVNLHAGTSITTAAFNAVSLGASGTGSRVVPDVLIPVVANGRGAMGVYVHDGGQVTLLPGSTLQMNGTSSVGVSVDNTTVGTGTIGSGLTINLNGAGVPAQAGSTGVAAFNNGSITLENLTVQGTNAAAGAWARPGGNITLTGRSLININAEQNPTSYTLLTPNLVTVAGNVSSAFGVTGAIPISGLLAQGAGAVITSIGTTINVSSANFAAGVDAGSGGLVDMTDNTVTTTGTSSFGVRVDSNGRVVGRDSSVTTSGGGAALFINGGPGSIDLTNTAVDATGAGTVGLSSLNLTSATTNSVNLTGGTLVSAASTGIEVQGPLNLTTSGTTVTGGGGLLLETFASTFGPAQPTALQFDASNGSVLTGDALVAAQTTANMNLTTGTSWTGASFDVTNVDVDPTSRWTVTASSTVTQLTRNAGLIQIVPPVGDPTLLSSYKTLTTQNYIGSSGTLILNTYLGADGAPSDILVVDGGTTTGSTSMIVRNTIGPGALTTANGILVVDTINGATSESTAFTLLGDYITDRGEQAVVGGAYAYTLNFGGVGADVTDNNWYLRSRLIPSPDPDPDPDPGPPLYQPGVPIYEAYPQNLLALNGLPTMQQRVGNRYWREPEPAPAEVFCKDPSRNFHCTVTQEQAGYYADGQTARATIEDNGVWGRLEGMHSRIEPAVTTSSTDYDINSWKLQAGLDGLLHEADDGSKLIGGITIHYGQASSDVSSIYGDGSIDTTGFGFGGTLTWLDQNGFYVDGQAALTWYDSDLFSDTAGLGLADGNNGIGYALSIETGKKIDLDETWTITPQAQLVYSHVDFDTFRDPFDASVSLDDGDSLRGRLGISADRDETWKDDEGKTRRGHLYGIANLYYEFLDASQVEVSGTKFQTRPERLWGGVGAGGSYNWDDDKYSVYGEVSLNTSLANFADSYTVGGTIGFRVKW